MKISVVGTILTVCLLVSCSSEDDPIASDSGDNGYVQLLTNQINQIIIPTMMNYQVKTGDFLSAANAFEANADAATLATLRAEYQEAYLAYQAAAVHNYFITSNLSLVSTSNLYPIDTTQLADFIANEAYSFNSSNQIRATGYPALDYMLYGPDDVLAYFNGDAKRVKYLVELVSFLKEKADRLVDGWSDEDLVSAFISSGGTGAGSSISSQLNNTLKYYEEHVRENKVGLPIGLSGPNDSPIPPDSTKIEAYYQSQVDGNHEFALSLVKVAVEEMEDIYMGSTSAGSNGQGYDDLLVQREHGGIDTDIKGQYQRIYTEIDSRTLITGDRQLYDEIQAIVTLYKTDLYPILNVEDTDMLNDGD